MRKKKIEKMTTSEKLGELRRQAIQDVTSLGNLLLALQQENDKLREDNERLRQQLVEKT